MNPTQPIAIFIFGGPGCGKGTQCKAIIDGFPNKFYHISTGALLREAIDKPETPNREFISKCMKEGVMVPSPQLVQLVKYKITTLGNKYIYIIDGFPRNEQNLTVWKQVFGETVEIKFLLNFQCSEQEMRKRLNERAKSSGRADDNPQTIEKRIALFNTTKQVLSLFQKNNGHLINVNADQYVEAVSQSVKQVLKKAGLV